MSDDKKRDDFDLDSILSEINSTIKKEVSKTNNVKTKKTGSSNDVAKRAAPKKPKTPKPATPKINTAFADSAKIIENAVEEDDEDVYANHAVRFIAVTASEVVEDYNPPPPMPVPTPPTESESVISLGSFTTPTTGQDSAPISLEPAKVVTPDDVTREGNRHIQKLRKKRNRPVMSKRQKFTAIIGAITSLLVIVGIVAVVISTTNLTYRAVDQTSLKTELAHAVFPFTIVDIPQFDDVKNLDNSVIISSAIWAFIIDDIDKSKYKQDDLGLMYVPDVDIELYIRNIFGNTIPIKHQTVDGSSVMMNYDETMKTYAIESTPKILPYRPRVDKINKKDEIYTLTVSYILPDAMWNFDSQDDKANADKTMQYVLKKNKNSYQVISVKVISIAGATEPPAPAASIDILHEQDDLLISDDVLATTSFVELSSVDSDEAKKSNEADAKTASEETTSNP